MRNRPDLHTHFSKRTRDDGTSFYKKLEEMVNATRDLRAHSTRTHWRPVSLLTSAYRVRTLFQVYRTLRNTLKYKIESPHALKNKHIVALVEHWRTSDISSSTIINRLSVIRVFAEVALGKEGMVRPAEEYCPDLVRQTAARVDRSASLHVEPMQFVIAARSFDERVSVQLRLCLEFGLRRNEAICLKPIESDRGRYLYIVEGSKGGRPRPIEITSVAQREALDAAKDFARHNPRGYISRPRQSLQSVRNHFKYVCGRIGLTKKGSGATPHSLRHDFMQRLFQEIAGVPAPIKGPSDARGDTAGLSTVAIELIERAQFEVANQAGHNRKSASYAYLGSIPQALARDRRAGYFDAPKDHRVFSDGRPEHSNIQLEPATKGRGERVLGDNAVGAQQ